MLADRVANGFGRSSTVILRRTRGASARQSPNAALPVRSGELSAGSGRLWANAAAAGASNPRRAQVIRHPSGPDRRVRAHPLQKKHSTAEESRSMDSSGLDLMGFSQHGR